MKCAINNIEFSNYDEDFVEEKTFKDINKFNKISYILISLNFGLSSLSDLSIQYYCKDILKLQPADYSRYITISQIPWIMKPLFGLLTDSFPICGKRRKYYIVLSGVAGFLSWLCIAYLSSSFFNLILFLTLMNASLSFSSVLGEAIVVELSKINSENISKNNKSSKNLDLENNIDEKSKKIEEALTDKKISNDIIKTREENNQKSQHDAKDYISLFFFFKYTGSLISALLKGYFIKIFSYSTIFMITGCISFLTVISGMILIEKKVDDITNAKREEIEMGDKVDPNRLKIIEKPLVNELKYNKLIEENNASDNTNPTNKDSTNPENYFSDNNFNANVNKEDIIKEDEKNHESNNISDIKSESTNISSESNKNFRVEKLKYEESLKTFENSSLLNQIKLIIDFLRQKYIFVPTILLIIFMSTPSYSDPIFYFFTEELKLDSVQLGLVSIFSIIFTLAAIVVYKYKLKKYSFRAMIIGCSLISFVFSFMTYMLTKRLNLLFGIPDMLIILFSTSINSLLGELTLMPMLSLACLLSPKNLEGTAYSIFMSALNFGAGLSIVSGSYFTQYMGITSKDFSNLPNLILISNVLSILPIPLFLMFSNQYFSPEHSEETENNAENQSINSNKKSPSMEDLIENESEKIKENIN